MAGFVPNTVRILTVLALVLLLESPLTSAKSSGHDFIVQMPVVVDKKGFDKWKSQTGKSTNEELKKYINGYMVDVTDIYKSLERFDPPLKIRFEIPEIRVLDKNIFDVSGNVVNNRIAMDQFHEWTEKNIPGYDVAFLYTGYDLVSDTKLGKGAFGAAYIGWVCDPRPVAILEINGKYRDVLAAAHEIGHSLGSWHDGENGTSCPKANGNVMTPNPLPPSTNHFVFSRCSYNMIYQTLVTDGKGKKCLSDGDATKIVKGPRFGAIVKPDDMCYKLLANEGYGYGNVDRNWYHNEANRQDMCVKLKCKTRLPDKFVNTPQGMACGKNKQCVQGKCVEDPSVYKDVSDSCPFGDQTRGYVTDFSQTCSTLPEGACFNYKVKCCQTCADVKISEADQECRKREGPSSSLVRVKYRYYGHQICAQLHCAYRVNEWTGDNMQSNPYPTPDGMKCGKNKVCRNKRCVGASPETGGDPYMTDECPYGDQPWIPFHAKTCKQVVDSGYGCRASWREKACCYTCANKNDILQPLDRTADQVCQDSYGKQWVLSRGDYSNYGNMCTDFKCVARLSGKLVRKTRKAPDGLACGKNKRCFKGECVETSSGDPNVSDHCPWGDQHLRDIGSGARCDRVSCKGSWKNWCCRACRGR